MKHALCVIALLSLSNMSNGQGQTNYPDVLLTNPYLSNGYFITNADRFRELNLSHLIIEINAYKYDQAGVMEKIGVESFEIYENDFFAKGGLDISF